ncbi:helix-turn-helix domain-containing protein [Lysinibacillus xylanilyticus]|uniref:helix-turn-helix domain-containing protein n=1 Tax=Lysinibacillus xylanilyticus TaxID=582475 RepID=UPI003D047E23
MRNLGFIFRDIRMDKGYSLKDIADGILSVSFLSKFERGDSDISLSKFYLLLERLNMTLDEFSFISNDYNLTQVETLMKNVRNAYENNNINLLYKLEQEEIYMWKKYNLSNHRYNSIMIRALAYDLNKQLELNQEDITLLNEYLFKVENWGFYETMLFGNSMSILSIDSIIIFSKEILIKTQLYSRIRKNKEKLIRVLLNTIFYCIESKRPLSALHFIISVEKILERHSDLYFEKVKLLYLNGIYKIISGNSNVGIDMSNKAIQIMNALGDINAVNNHEIYLMGKIEFLNKTSRVLII